MDQPDQPSLFSANELPTRRDEAWELPDTGHIPQSEEGLGIAASLQMELSAKCMRFIAALRDVGVNPALSLRQNLIGHMTLLSNNLQLLTAGAVGPNQAPEVVAETRRAWQRMNELREDLFASLPSGPARAVLEREAELADIPLEEIDDGAEDDEDSWYEDTSWIDEILGHRLEQTLRENHEERPLPPSLRHRALLKALPVEWLDAICETIDIRHRRLRKDREKALVSVLTDPDGLEEVLYQLAPEEIDALRFLLEHGGVSKATALTRRFGDDSEDPHFWSENPPTSVLGELRVRGLVFVGRMVHGKQNCRTAAIPVELRQPIAAALEDLEPGEMDPEAELRSVHRTIAAWCEGAFSGADEDLELAVDIAHTVADLMANYQEELPREWTVSALMECLTEDVPRKITADDDYFDAIPDAMITLLEHAAEAGELEKGRELARVIRSRAGEIQRAARDPERWGMAKTVLMAAQADGVDPTDNEAMGDFIDRWNDRAAPPPEPRRSTKIGRNQPCPCGSGKKYKRCCG